MLPRERGGRAARSSFGASLQSEESRGYFPGHTLANRYELLRLLGEGGTGVVWSARDRVLNLEVALKLVRKSEAGSEDFARRAQLEACSAARIALPAVCRAVDFGLSEYGEPFIVSELLTGESLDDAIAAAAGAALVALLGSAGALRFDEAPLERPRAAAPLSLADVPEVAPRSAAVAATPAVVQSPTVTPEVGASLEAQGSVANEASPPAVRPRPSLPRGTGVGPPARAPVAATAAAVAEAPSPRSTSPRRRATNALNYDFGL